MSLEVSSISQTSSTTQVNSKNSTDNSSRTSNDSSFKDEMKKVSSTKEKDNKKVEEKNDVDNKKNIENKEKTKKSENDEIDYANYGSIALNDAKNMLASDIELMMKNNQIQSANLYSDPFGEMNVISSFDNKSNFSRISMTENDAKFFINLTENNEINVQNITAQAQNLINNGASEIEVKQNVQISQTLLDAISKAKENNQPLRIDFDQNVSVILRIGKDGVLAANFIPGDKAVEQYLKNNINNLKATFEENDLPYKELSYGSSNNRGQNNRKRNKQQGDDK